MRLLLPLILAIAVEGASPPKAIDSDPVSLITSICQTYLDNTELLTGYPAAKWTASQIVGGSLSVQVTRWRQCAGRSSQSPGRSSRSCAGTPAERLGEFRGKRPGRKAAPKAAGFRFHCRSLAFSRVQRLVGFPAIDFRLRDLARLDQGIDATLGEAVPHLVHAHAQRRALEAIVAAIFVVVGATSLLNRLAVTIRMRSPRHAEERQAKSDK